MASDKPQHARRGDVLLDDNLKAQLGWEAVGGVFVHFTSAPPAIVALQQIFIKKAPKRICVSAPVCHNFQDSGQCRFGTECRFWHSSSVNLPSYLSLTKAPAIEQSCTSSVILGSSSVSLTTAPAVEQFCTSSADSALTAGVGATAKEDPGQKSLKRRRLVKLAGDPQSADR
jgi:hypothetical protein